MAANFDFLPLVTLEGVVTGAEGVVTGVDPVDIEGTNGLLLGVVMGGGGRLGIPPCFSLFCNFVIPSDSLLSVVDGANGDEMLLVNGGLPEDALIGFS